MLSIVRRVVTSLAKVLGYERSSGKSTENRTNRLRVLTNRRALLYVLSEIFLIFASAYALFEFIPSEPPFEDSILIMASIAVFMFLKSAFSVAMNYAKSVKCAYLRGGTITMTGDRALEVRSICYRACVVTAVPISILCVLTGTPISACGVGSFLSLVCSIVFTVLAVASLLLIALDGILNIITVLLIVSGYTEIFVPLSKKKTIALGG